MKKNVRFLFCLCALHCLAIACKQQGLTKTVTPPVDTSLVSTRHLDYLYTPVTFSNGIPAAGIYIYADAPDYHLVADSDEGYTCIDDVSRAVLVYLRSSGFANDTGIQQKTFSLLRFIIEMQADNGYFYNFLLTGNQINKFGSTSVAGANWWSWRALQALTEAVPLIKIRNTQLLAKVQVALDKVVARIKSDMVNLPLNTKVVQGITVPEWLPYGSAADQAATLILALIPYYAETNDQVIKSYIRKLADGIAMMQLGDATHYPYSCLLSFENKWHGYGSDQAYALLKAGAFLNDTALTRKGLAEADNFYPWLLSNGLKSSIAFSSSNGQVQALTESNYDQIAYFIRPMVFAASEAFQLTGNAKYADIAGHLAAWLLGSNVAGINMYDRKTGRCFDGISSGNNVNRNSGAESTIEALLTLQRVEKDGAVKAAMDKYKK